MGEKHMKLHEEDNFEHTEVTKVIITLIDLKYFHQRGLIFNNILMY